MKVKFMFAALLVFVGLTACKAPASAVSGPSDTGAAGATPTGKVTETAEDVAPDVAVEGKDLPFNYRLGNVELTTSDTKKVVASFGYTGHVKAGVANQQAYVREKLEPVMHKATIKVLSAKTAEQLSEENWSAIKSEIFREIQGGINPQEVKVKELKAIQITVL
jgi:hypothetical protein